MSMKSLLRRLKLDELSLVDRGANPGARVTLWKRDDSLTQAVAKVDREPLVALCRKFLGDENPEMDFSDALRSELEQQQRFEVHDKLFPLFDALRESVMTAAAELEGEDREQKLRDNVESFLAAVRGEMNDLAKAAGFQTAGSPGNPSTSTGEDDMSEQLEKKVGELEAQVAELTKQTEELTAERDALKADVDEVLEATGATLEKGEDGEAEVKLQKAEEYVEINGEKVAKSEVPGPVLKAIEAQNAEIAKIRAERETESLAKRAKEELPNLAGDDALKGKLLKFVDGLDEDEAKAMREALKAADTATSKMFAEVGHNPADDEASATYKLRKRVEEYQAEHNLPSREVAFAKFKDTPEGRELRKAADAEQQ